MARLKTQVQIGIVFDMLSGNRFPLRVESTIMQPPFCPTPSDVHANIKSPQLTSEKKKKSRQLQKREFKHLQETEKHMK